MKEIKKLQKLERWAYNNLQGYNWEREAKRF